MAASTHNQNRSWTLKERPPGLVGPEHFNWVTSPMPEPGPGQILVKSLYFSCDPTQRGWLHAEGGYIAPVAIGEAMRAGGVGQVVASNAPGFEPGDLIQGTLAWSDFVVVTPGAGLTPVTKVSKDYPLTWNFSVFGLTTLTAYFGLLHTGEMKAGDVVLVSGAAGATGSVVGQIAKIKGASKVIGIAGGAEKCRWLVEEGGFDAAIDYKKDDIAFKIKEHAPQGVDVFFDNVGGDCLDAALMNLKAGSRVVICGGISTGYASWSAPEGPKNYMNLILHGAAMKGFLVLHFMAEFGKAMAEIGQWVREGKLKVKETVVEGLENAPAALQGLFTGKNLGKMIIKVADPL